MTPVHVVILAGSLLGSVVLLCGAAYGVYRFGQAFLDRAARDLR